MTGPAAVDADTSVGNQQTVMLLTALIIVAVILLLVYRSPVLWLLPLAGAVAGRAKFFPLQAPVPMEYL